MEQLDLTEGNVYNTLVEFVDECFAKGVPMKDCIGAVTAMAKISGYADIVDVDKFVSDIYPPIAPARRKGKRIVVIDCPYCHEEHWHGMGENPDVFGSGDGHRTSHCVTSEDNRGYVVKQIRDSGLKAAEITELEIDIVYFTDVSKEEIHHRVSRALSLEFREDFPRIEFIDVEFVR